jgi:hypothetical protein
LLLHAPPSDSSHPERPDRTAAIMARLLATGLVDRCKRVGHGRDGGVCVLGGRAPTTTSRVCVCVFGGDRPCNRSRACSLASGHLSRVSSTLFPGLAAAHDTSCSAHP